MNLSNTAQYAIRILSYMVNKEEKIYSAAHLIKELKISDKYLRRIMTSMTKQGINESVQGRYGGFVLRKTPDKILLIDIISAVEDKSKYEGCVLGFEKCSDENPCALHNRWAVVRTEISNFLNQNTLEQFVNKQEPLKF